MKIRRGFCWMRYIAVITIITIYSENVHSKDLVIDFDVKDLITDLERLSKARTDNFINILERFLTKYQVWPSSGTDPNKRSWTPSTKNPNFRFFEDLYLNSIISPTMTHALPYLRPYIGLMVPHFRINPKDKKASSLPVSPNMRRLQIHFFPHIKTGMKLLPQATHRKRSSSTSPDIFYNVQDPIPEKYKSNFKSEKKRSDESEGFGVDLNDVEPFERSVREQEGRRYLLWRKVTG